MSQGIQLVEPPLAVVAHEGDQHPVEVEQGLSSVSPSVVWFTNSSTRAYDDVVVTRADSTTSAETTVWSVRLEVPTPAIVRS